MTYCTASSSRDLFNYWGGEGWGAAKVQTERGRASASAAATVARPAWNRGIGPRLLEGTGWGGLTTAPAQERSRLGWEGGRWKRTRVGDAVRGPVVTPGLEHRPCHRVTEGKRISLSLSLLSHKVGTRAMPTW